MHIDIKTKDEDGNVLFEGKLNRNEVGFLIQYAVNDLIAAGVQFHLDQEEDEDEDDDDAQMRLEFPEPQGGLN